MVLFVGLSSAGIFTLSSFRWADITKANSKEARRMAMTRVEKGRSIEGMLGTEGIESVGKLGKLGMWV